MTVENLIRRLCLCRLSELDAGIGNAPVCGVIACDLMSEVLVRGRASMAWITVQTHINVVALASFLQMPLVIVSCGITVPAATIARAERTHVAIVSTTASTYELCGQLYAAGVGS